MNTLCLVTCVAEKRRDASPARNLYQSPLFSKARRFAEDRYDSWFILSARHGLVHPDDVLAPYDQSLLDSTDGERRTWAVRVFEQLSRQTNADDRVAILAGKPYRKHLVPLLLERGHQVTIPMEGLRLGEQLAWLKEATERRTIGRDVDRFYQLLELLRERLSGMRRLSECTGRSDWPERGVYFFFDPREYRTTDPRQPRVVRVGTHAVSRGSKSMLWNRLYSHRGTVSGGGNHRASIFRLHVGAAMIRRSDGALEVRSWGEGQSASRGVRAGEKELEELVSRYVGQLPFLWLSVLDEPGTQSDRSYLEKNAVGLLSGSGAGKPFETPTVSWLGRFSAKPQVRDSGLWNIDHVGKGYDPRFLDVLADYIRRPDSDRP